MTTCATCPVFVDSVGRQIYPGDLLRSPHFIGSRGRRHYLYHTVVTGEIPGTLEIVPTCHLEPSKRNGGGRCRLSADLASSAEIIYGFGPGELWTFHDRPKHPERREGGKR